jgi:predicted acetyltransferase
MDIRILTEDEIKGAHAIWAQAYHYGDRAQEEKSWEDDTYGKTFTCGVYDGAGLQAVLVINDYRIHLGPEVIVPMGGVGGVASLPASRGKGYAGALLRFSLAEMKERGHVVSALFPFSWAYYRRYGWEWVGHSRGYKVPTSILPASPETEQVRLATPGDRDRILALYTQFAGRYRGMFSRTEVAWNHILNDQPKQYTYTYVYERDGVIEGYLTYRGGKEEEVGIREFLTLTARAQRGLLGLLRRHDMQVKKFTWDAPEDDTLWSQFYHWDIETDLRPRTQGRVVDVPNALQAWKPAPEAQGALNLGLQDEHAPWNTGTWRIEFADCAVSVRPTSETPHVECDIQAFSQAFYGRPTVAHLRAADRLHVHDEAGFTALQALLDGPPMWMNNEF